MYECAPLVTCARTGLLCYAVAGRGGGLSLTFGNDYGQDSGTSLALSAISASSNRAGRCSVAALPKSAMSQLVTGWSHWLHLASRSLVGVSFCCAGEGGGEDLPEAGAAHLAPVVQAALLCNKLHSQPLANNQRT